MEKKNPDERAKELHDKIKHKHTRDRNTTAVLNTETDIVIVGSNEIRLRKEQREAFNEKEVEATGIGHAEETVILKADELNIQGIEIGASRPICEDCQELIQEKNIKAKTELSGKKSKKSR